MKNLILLLLILPFSLTAQDAELKNKASFELGSGLNFSLNEGAYEFTLGGMIQPSFAFDKLEGGEADYYFNAKRSYFNFSGKAVKEKVSFFLQTDFSLTEPLLDAWIAFHATEQLTVTFGQKQGISNNREMMIMEDQLQFPDRGLISDAFSGTGREFGLFLEGKFGSSTFGIVPQVAITSGDGRNSFGTDSRDVDLGGLKYGARLDIYPLGFFSEGNDKSTADLAHEESPKLVLGVAASYNDGASHSAGEGHGDFFLYNADGRVQLPDYRQVYGDILVKYKGISVLGEYLIATATSLLGSHLDEFGATPLIPTQISEYLSLGTALNAQVGYVTTSGYALDLRYGMLFPEFAQNQHSIVQEMTAFTAGLSRYVKGNNLKVQAAFTAFSSPSGPSRNLGELVFQLRF